MNVPLGYRVACTLVNQTASLTLLKNVVNDNGGSATAERVEPHRYACAPSRDSSPRRSAAPRRSVPASTFQVRPRHVYTLTESNVPGYQFQKLQQFVGGAWVDVVANPDPLRLPAEGRRGQLAGHGRRRSTRRCTAS